VLFAFIRLIVAFSAGSISVTSALLRRNIVKFIGVVALEPAAFSNVKSTASAELLRYGGFGLVQELCQVWTCNSYVLLADAD
jgi:hypothetical protein